MRELDSTEVARVELEVLNPSRRTIRETNFVRALGDDAQPKILEHRQHVGDGNRLHSLDDLQVEPIRWRVWRRVQIESQRIALCANRFEVFDVLERTSGVHVVLVGGREGAGIGLCERRALRAIRLREQGIS